MSASRTLFAAFLPGARRVDRIAAQSMDSCPMSTGRALDGNALTTVH